MNTFEITLHRKVEGSWLVVVERSASGSALPMRSEGELALSVEELQIALRDPKAYGQLLGQGGFTPNQRTDDDLISQVV